MFALCTDVWTFRVLCMTGNLYFGKMWCSTLQPMVCTNHKFPTVQHENNIQTHPKSNEHNYYKPCFYTRFLPKFNPDSSQFPGLTQPTSIGGLELG